MIYLIIGSALLLIWGLVYPGTDYYLRWLAPGVIRRGRGPGKRICLTFDDGPDELFTPQVLKILRRFQVPAVFFLIAAQAERFPELVRQIQTDGHGVGLHSWKHRHAYLMLGSQSRQAITEGRQRLQTMVKEPLRWYRSPWGATNLWQSLILKKLKLRLVLWSVQARDWKAATGAEEVRRRLRQRLRPGSIIVLHDAGGEAGAPAHTVQALPELLQQLRNDGYQFVGLDDLLREVGDVSG